MRKYVFIVWLAVVLVGGCKKEAVAPFNGASYFTYQGQAMATGSSVGFNAYNQQFADLMCQAEMRDSFGNFYGMDFYFDRKPIATASYIITDQQHVSPGRVAISQGHTGFWDYNTVYGNATDKVQVTVLSNGHINITGNNIMLDGGSHGTTATTFNITTTQ